MSSLFISEVIARLDSQERLLSTRASAARLASATGSPSPYSPYDDDDDDDASLSETHGAQEPLSAENSALVDLVPIVQTTLRLVVDVSHGQFNFPGGYIVSFPNSRNEVVCIADPSSDTWVCYESLCHEHQVPLAFPTEPLMCLGWPFGVAAVGNIQLVVRDPLMTERILSLDYVHLLPDLEVAASYLWGLVACRPTIVQAATLRGSWVMDLSSEASLPLGSALSAPTNDRTERGRDHLYRGSAAPPSLGGTGGAPASRTLQVGDSITESS